MKTFVIPALQRYGTVSDITASDFKCTPGGDGGYAGVRYSNDGTDLAVYNHTTGGWEDINDVLGPTCRSGVGHTNEPTQGNPYPWFGNVN